VDISACDGLGAGGYLAKPIKPSGLLDALCAALQGLPSVTVPVMSPTVDFAIPSNSLQILLVEDSLVNQKLTVALLRKRGHEVVIANNGKEGVSAAKEQQFDLVLMDVQMPEMDGYDATASIRAYEQKLGRHTPIIALTAHAMTGDRERCLQAGMDEYLTKPVRAEELFDTITLVLKRNESVGPAGERKDTSPIAIIDWQRALLASGNDPHRLATFLDAVIEVLPGLLESIQQTVQAGDGGGLQVAARTLMESIRYLGVVDAINAAFELERMGRDDRIQEARELLPTFQPLMEYILKACIDHVSQMSSTDNGA
jgi:two-component system sensor histidine kinase/response regulator